MDFHFQILSHFFLFHLVTSRITQWKIPAYTQSNSRSGGRSFCSHCWFKRYPRQIQPGHKSALGKQSQALAHKSNCTVLYSRFQWRLGLHFLFQNYLLTCANTNTASGFYLQTITVPFVSSCFFILHCKSAISISSPISPVHFPPVFSGLLF